LSTIETIITSSRATVECIVLGFIRKNTRRITGYLLEDSTGDVPIEFSGDVQYQHPIILENSFVLIEGIYYNEEDVLVISKIGYPPPKIHEKQSSHEIASHIDARMFVILRDIHLDDADTFQKLRILLTGYDSLESCPDCFVLIGPFCYEEVSTDYSRSKNSGPELPYCDFQPKSSKPAFKSSPIEANKHNVNRCLAELYTNKMVLTQGHMQYVWDNSGKRYLDMFSGIVTISVGHCHPKLVDVISAQSKKLWHLSRAYVYEEIYEFSSKLARRLPSSLSTIFLCNSGSEANDLALILARLHTRSFDVVALRNAYHGCSLAVMGLTGISSWKFPLPTSFGIHHTTNPDPYRGKYGGKACRDSQFQVQRDCICAPNECLACNHYIEDLQDLLNTIAPSKGIAGFIAESIQGVGGVVQYPKDFLKKAYQLIKQRGGVFIIDEVQTGFGRTGSNFWGFQNHNVTPDIVTMAKGIGNGFPLAAVATTPEIASVMEEALYFNTFGGNPLASVVGSKVLDIIDEEMLQQNSYHLGARMMVGLKSLMNRYENVIGDIRGKGLMIGIDLINDQKSQTPMEKADVNAILEDCKNMGLLIGKGGSFGNVLRIKPPMCVNDADIQFALEVLKISFENHLSRKKGKIQ
ncbi:hypothetical protein B4U79_05290, partial [Dinothrombium tinctorium]